MNKIWFRGKRPDVSKYLHLLDFGKYPPTQQRPKRLPNTSPTVIPKSHRKPAKMARLPRTSLARRQWRSRPKPARMAAIGKPLLKRIVAKGKRGAQQKKHAERRQDLFKEQAYKRHGLQNSFLGQLKDLRRTAWVGSNKPTNGLHKRKLWRMSKEL